MSVYLGIEIGGTKLQLGIGTEHARLIDVCRLDIDPNGGAIGILRQIQRAGRDLIARHRPVHAGIGFGGPVDPAAGRVIRSHQIAGWKDHALVDWCSQTLGLPASLGNDCDLAALAEARFGAGRGYGSLFFVTAGTGVGGGYVVDGRVQGAGRPAFAEIGHLRPGLQADRADQTVESLASGWGIAAAARAEIQGDVSLRLDRAGESHPIDRNAGRMPPDRPDIELVFRRDLLERCGDDVERLTAKDVACAASEGNQLAMNVLRRAAEVLGWAIAQMINLLAPEIVVIGGGVSLIGESLFFAPLRDAVSRYVFPPLAQTQRIVPAALGELVVVQGAIALAAQQSADGDTILAMKGANAS
ncbi:MAG: ROK family protein [Planctomycetaceae bacterium]|nr:MAG: ROK family protein [Planctomycetaceae bacterium]